MKPTNSTWPWLKPQASGHTVTTWVPLTSTSVGCGAIVEDALTSDHRLGRYHRSPTWQHQDNIMATKGPQLRFGYSLLAGQSRRDSRWRSRQGAGRDFGTVRESRGPANRGFDRRPRGGSVIAVRSIAQRPVGRCVHRGQRSRARRGAGNIQRQALPWTKADHRPRSLSQVDLNGRPHTWPMEQRISLVTFGVRDLGRALAFYKALGWSDAQQPDDEIASFQAGGMVFGLWTALGGHGAPGIELAHNVRSPEEVDALIAAALQAGGRIVPPAAQAEWGGHPGPFPDPEGYVWGVAHNPDLAPAAGGRGPPPLG